MGLEQQCSTDKMGLPAFQSNRNSDGWQKSGKGDCTSVMSCIPEPDQETSGQRWSTETSEDGKHGISGQWSPYHQLAGDLNVGSDLLMKGACIMVIKSLQKDILEWLHSVTKGIRKSREREQNSRCSGQE